MSLVCTLPFGRDHAMDSAACYPSNTCILFALPPLQLPLPLPGVIQASRLIGQHQLPPAHTCICDRLATCGAIIESPDISSLCLAVLRMNVAASSAQRTLILPKWNRPCNGFGSNRCGNFALPPWQLSRLLSLSKFDVTATT